MQNVAFAASGCVHWLQLFYVSVYMRTVSVYMRAGVKVCKCVALEAKRGDIHIVQKMLWFRWVVQQYGSVRSRSWLLCG